MAEDGWRSVRRDGWQREGMQCGSRASRQADVTFLLVEANKNTRGFVWALGFDSLEAAFYDKDYCTDAVKVMGDRPRRASWETF